ncbi:MAG: hypothetical protein R6U88_04595 [Candidatus Bipolaricaulota bacterium]
MADPVRLAAYSGDPLLVERALSQRLQELGEADRVPLFADELTPDELASQVLTPPLFGGQRALVVRRADTLVLSSYLAQRLERGLPPDTAVLFVGDKLRGPVVRIAEEAQHFARPKGRTLRSLAKSLLEEAGLPTYEFLLGMLVEACGRGSDQEKGTLRLLREVEKLAVWKGGTLSKERIPELIYAAQAPPYPLLDALGARDVPAALRELRRLVTGTPEAFRLFFLVVTHVRNLLVARAALDRGEQPPGPAWLARRRAAQASKFSQAELIGLLERLQELDLQIKTGRIGAPAALACFTLSLAP